MAENTLPKRMKLSWKPFELLLKYPFSISGFSRTFTPVMLTELSLDGIIGTGEASMVPYMGESFQTAQHFLSKLDLSWLRYPFNYDELNAYLDSITPKNPAVKAAVDIALHDLQGKIEGKPCHSYWDSEQEKMPFTSVTIGIDTPDVIRKKVADAASAKILKVKLGSADDKQLIQSIREVSDKPLFADANQGWQNKEQALELVYWLQGQGVEIIEQPMPKEDLDGNAWITERSPIPILADEAVQRLSDIEHIKGAYHGINVKLMKSAGLHEAHLMIKRTRELNMKVLIGCMSETSVATLAGISLAPLCDWADLDGPFLTSNNPFKAPAFNDGKWILSNNPGLGLAKE